MDTKPYKALVVEEKADQIFERDIRELHIKNLPQGDVLIKVHYSSLNYKDVLSATGNKGVTRNYPHTPGIDAAGVVVESSVDSCHPGDEVIVTSYDLGMNTAGGLGQYIRVPSGWVVNRPENLSLRESMIYGTAGFTAALSVYQLMEHGITPESGSILVTGATGGVGSIAVSIMAKMGFSVTALSGHSDRSDYLKEIGATSVIGIDDALDKSKRPMLKGKWAGCVDTVGGEILSTAIKSMNPGGVVTCCGNVASPDLPLTVFPFILRGVILVGIDSQNCAMALRQKTWNKIAGDWKLDRLETLTTETTLDAVNSQIDLMLKGEHQGRIIVRLWDTIS